MWENFNLLNEFNILRIMCGLFFIPHIVGKYTEPKALELFNSFGLKPAKVWLNIACIVEIILTICLFFGILTPYVAAVAAIHLAIAAFCTYRFNNKWLWHIGGCEYCVFWALACVVVAMHAWHG